jgi:hypothetical protein
MGARGGMPARVLEWQNFGNGTIVAGQIRLLKKHAESFVGPKECHVFASNHLSPTRQSVYGKGARKGAMTRGRYCRNYD